MTGVCSQIDSTFLPGKERRKRKVTCVGQHIFVFPFYILVREVGREKLFWGGGGASAAVAPDAQNLVFLWQPKNAHSCCLT